MEVSRANSNTDTVQQHKTHQHMNNYGNFNYCSGPAINIQLQSSSTIIAPTPAKIQPLHHDTPDDQSIPPEVMDLINQLVLRIHEEQLLAETEPFLLVQSHHDEDPYHQPITSDPQRVEAQSSIVETGTVLETNTDGHIDDSMSFQRDSPQLSPDDVTSDLVIDSTFQTSSLQDQTLETDESMSAESESPKEVESSSLHGIELSGPEQRSTEPPELQISHENDATTILAPEPMEAQVEPRDQIPTQETEAKGPSEPDNDSSRIEDSDQKEALVQDPPTHGSAQDDSLSKELGVLSSEGCKVVVPQELDDSHEEKDKDIVTLRNLEISPPPGTNDDPAPKTDDREESTCTPDDQSETKTSTKYSAKRKRSTYAGVSSKEQSDSNTESGGRSKRLRTKTQLFQAGETKAVPEQKLQTKGSKRTKAQPVRSKSGSTKPSARTRKKSTASSSSEANLSTSTITTNANTTATQNATFHSDLQDVIFYEKNDYLAIRNEEDTFYLCQLAENVKIQRPLIKIKWLDTNNDGKTYFLTAHYDKVPQKSIIMPVMLNKLKGEKKGEQLFSLEEQDRENIMERLKRSLNATTETESSQEVVSDS